MNRNGPIIVIEDDLDDQNSLKEVFRELNFKNEIIFLGDGVKAYDYLMNKPVEPFLILSDINMPRLNGLELRQKIQNNADLRQKCIPYLFFSSSADQQHVVDAYSNSIQGFFVKPSSMPQLTNTMRKIVEYWQECISPNYCR